MPAHHLAASVDACHWGFFDAALPPALTIASGDTVTIDTVTGDESFMPPAGFHIPPELHEIHARSKRMEPGHILTGPVAVAGAKPGQTLEVRIKAISLRQDWGFQFVHPLMGTLPGEFDTPKQINIPLDAARGMATMPWGLELPLSLFFGVMGVAPPKAWGRISSIQPRLHGGNLDNKELVAGTTLFLPIHVEGAMFSCGDGHGAQGDGEVCVTAIETALQGTFELIVHDAPLSVPRAETPDRFLTMGLDPSLDEAAKMALREMIALITARTDLSRHDAYMLCSLAADLRITQTVNGVKGVHCLLDKALLA